MEPVAYRLFTDGSRRPVYDDGERQWVEDDDNRVYGVSFIPREVCDTPIVVGDDLPADW